MFIDKMSEIEENIKDNYYQFFWYSAITIPREDREKKLFLLEKNIREYLFYSLKGEILEENIDDEVEKKLTTPNYEKVLLQTIVGDNISINGMKKYLNQKLTKVEKRKFFLHRYNNISKEEKEQIVQWAQTYKKFAKNYEGVIPQSYEWLINLLWGDSNISLEWSYVESLFSWEQEITNFLEQKAEQKRILANLPKIRDRESFLQWYKNLSSKEQKEIISWGKRYRNIVQKYQEIIPSIYSSLITTLWGNPQCTEGGYVDALLQWKKQGNVYFNDWEKRNHQKLKSRESFLRWYETLPKEEKDTFFKGFESYKIFAQKYPNILPKTYIWLITLLEGNPSKSLNKEYVKSLFISPKNGSQFLKNQIKNREDFFRWYQLLTPLQKSRIKKGDREYRIFAKQYEWLLPQTYIGLINILWGNGSLCSNKRYVEALLHSTEAWKKYIKNKITTREEFIQWFKEIPQFKKEEILWGIEHYRKTAPQYKGKIPLTYFGLISLLWGDVSCLDKEYVQALLQSQKIAQKFLNAKKKNK